MDRRGEEARLRRIWELVEAVQQATADSEPNWDDIGEWVRELAVLVGEAREGGQSQAGA